jgi:hypothetical protein
LPRAGCGVFNQPSTQSLALKSAGAESVVIEATFAVIMRTHASRLRRDPECFGGLMVIRTSRPESVLILVHTRRLRQHLSMSTTYITRRADKTTPHGCGFYSQKPVIRPYRCAKNCSKSTSIWIVDPDRHALIRLTKLNVTAKSIHAGRPSEAATLSS